MNCELLYDEVNDVLSLSAFPVRSRGKLKMTMAKTRKVIENRKQRYILVEVTKNKEGTLNRMKEKANERNR